MDTLELPASPRVKLACINAEVSRLGFGTSALMSRVNRRDSHRLLDTAWEAGITHFDTARSYGFGDAEMILGEFLGGRREQSTVTTKVGILPPRRSLWLSSAKAAARALINAMPSARSYVRKGAAQLLPDPRFDAVAMTRSLETSLRALGTSYVDFLLLHEPRMDVLRSSDPLAFLQRMREQGKVKFTGVATDHPGVLYVLSEMPDYATVLQQPHCPFSRTRPTEEYLRKSAVFGHSCLGKTVAALGTELESNTTLAAEWSRSLDLDITAPGMVEQLTLLLAFTDLPRSGILFTTTRAEHIRENAAAFKLAASSDQLERFRSLMLSRLGD